MNFYVRIEPEIKTLMLYGFADVETPFKKE